MYDPKLKKPYLDDIEQSLFDQCTEYDNLYGLFKLQPKEPEKKQTHFRFLKGIYHDYDIKKGPN